MKGSATAKGLILCLAGFLALSPSFAQTAKDKAEPKIQEARAILKALALKPEEQAKIDEILSRDEPVLARKRADVEVLQAQIARALLDPNPSLEQIGSLVKQIQAAEYHIRMAQFSRQLEIRKLLGDKRWATLYRLGKAVVEANRTGRLKEAFDARRLDKEELAADVLVRLFLGLPCYRGDSAFGTWAWRVCANTAADRRRRAGRERARLVPLDKIGEEGQEGPEPAAPLPVEEAGNGKR